MLVLVWNTRAAHMAHSTLYWSVCVCKYISNVYILKRYIQIYMGHSWIDNNILLINIAYGCCQFLFAFAFSIWPSPAGASSACRYFSEYSISCFYQHGYGVVLLEASFWTAIIEPCTQKTITTKIFRLENTDERLICRCC